VSFCASVGGFALPDLPAAAGIGLPAPLNVPLDGAPKIDGCAAGAALHASAVTHSGGAIGGEAGHGSLAEHTCASYTSGDPSTSCGASFADVMKNTSSPDSLASKNDDSLAEEPEEIKLTHPSARSLNVALIAAHSYGL
jgi:hypothetical protein